jgi:hypothetical protein
MSQEVGGFREASLNTPIRDLGLRIEGTRLEPIIAEFLAELDDAGLRRLRPRFYLSLEWGVPEDTIAIAIPFYLARPDLTELHSQRVGHVEGASRIDILRYLRHEMGHVVNYAYELYEQREWVQLFGSMTQPYVEDYRPQPFSRRYVRHLPGWYAQKHPDEDWAETFAVWMTPGRTWRAEYAGWGLAFDKLEYCDRTLTRLAETDPVVTDDELDEDVSEIPYSVEQYYRDMSEPHVELPQGLDGALRAAFEASGGTDDGVGAERPASELIRRLERDVLSSVFTWTGHFPEHTRALVRHLANRADELGLTYRDARGESVTIALTTLITALAMNHVVRGSYLP